ncbi:MAG: glutamate-5-semialdehyde dehydrogenase [Christensenellales bacterium]|jgi:glutamate-5-semialdehyde dehydrogenase
MSVKELCVLAKQASYSLGALPTAQKNNALWAIGRHIQADKDLIFKANQKDLELAAQNGKPQSFLDRLLLTESRLQGILEGLDAVAALADPVGEVVEQYTVKSGLNIKRVRAPLGVIGIIYEARPNVTIDAIALTLKSGNAVVLRGSKDAANSNAALVNAAKKGLKEAGIDENAVVFLGNPDREDTRVMLAQQGLIDVVIPRGGEELKKFVLEHALMPVIASAGGNCHLFVEGSANQEKAIPVIVNAKIQRPSVCNALETLLVERSIAKEFLPKIAKALEKEKVILRGDDEVRAILPHIEQVGIDEYYKEYNDLILKIKIVQDTTCAITHINKYGTGHSEAIITENKICAQQFAQAVDSAAVFINASTRFTDGFEFGLGAEMGISTQKLHVRGPIGLRELTGVKYVAQGDYTSRG